MTSHVSTALKEAAAKIYAAIRESGHIDLGTPHRCC